MNIPPEYFHPVAKCNNILRLQLTSYAYNEFSGTIFIHTNCGDVIITKNEVDPETLLVDMRLPDEASHTFNIEYRNVLLVPLYIYHMDPEIWNSLPNF